MTDRRPPTHGLRFSRTDAVVLVVGAALTWALLRPIGTFALLVPVTLLHFLLFCNVFRVRRGAELLWAAAFLVNFAAWALSDAFSWWTVLGVQTPVTLAILVVEVRHPRYHGLALRRPKARHGDGEGRVPGEERFRMNAELQYDARRGAERGGGSGAIERGSDTAPQEDASA